MKKLHIKLMILNLFFSFNFIAQNSAKENYLQLANQANDFRDFHETACEPSTISGTKFLDYHTGIKKPYIFHGDFSTPLTLGGENYISGRKRKFHHSVQFVPCAKIRIFENDPSFQDKSKPVRTPSFYPKLHYYISKNSLWNAKKKANYYGGIGLLHHSNGQDGTEFVDYTDSVNIYNGSFSESVILHFLCGGRLNLQEKEIDLSKKHSRKIVQNKEGKVMDLPQQKNQELFWKAGFEWHPVNFSNQKFHKTGVYGGNRLFTNIQYVSSKKYQTKLFSNERWEEVNNSRVKEKFRISANIEYITDRSFYSGGFLNLEEIKLGNLEKRLNLTLTYYKRILNSKYPALFAQVAYFGSDNYNIYFQKSLFQARIGLAYGFFRFN